MEQFYCYSRFVNVSWATEGGGPHHSTRLGGPRDARCRRLPRLALAQSARRARHDPSHRAACLYRGVEDIGEVFGPPLTEDEKEQRYQESAPLATTLQVPAEMWPEDRKAFDEYWNEAMAQVSIDDTIRQHLLDIATMRFLHAPVPQLLGRFGLFITTGFLPQHFRDEMRLTWSHRQQRRFDRLMRALGAVVRALPGPLRRFPYNLCLLDLRVRIRLGLRLV